MTHLQPCPPEPPCCPPGWSEEALACWRQMQELMAIIRATVAPDIERLERQIASLQRQLNAVTLGVTDGSNAAPGHIGEYLMFTTTATYAAYPTVTDKNVTLGTLGAGDWLCFLTTAFTTAVGTAATYLDPVPSGFSNGMGSSSGSWSPAGVAFETLMTLHGEPARASRSSAVAIPVKLRVDQEADPGLPAGMATFWFQAWRMR